MKIKSTSLFILFCFLLVSGFIQPVLSEFELLDGDVIPIYDANATILASVAWSGHDQSFYNSEADRWYALYPVQYSAGNYRLYYSYTDSGNYTTWTSGGAFTDAVLVASLAVDGCPVVSAWGSWVFDPENDLGHCAYYGRDDDALYYFNFTVNVVSGLLENGDEVALYDTASSGFKASVDICLDSNNYPMIAFTPPIDVTFQNWVLICDSTDGFNGAWEVGYFDPGFTGRQQSTIIPMGSQKAMIISQDLTTENPLKYAIFEAGSITNGTSGTNFSDDSVWRASTSNVYIGGIGVNYNSTHGCVAYTATTSDEVVAFVFDFLTLTKSDEYPITSGMSNVVANPMVAVHDNEFFVLCVESCLVNPDLYISEYHNASYGGFFNESQRIKLLDNFADATTSMYLGSTVSRSTDDDGNVLILTEDGSYASCVFVTLTGEYPSSEDYITFSADLEDVDDDGADWVFTNWKYYGFSFETNMQPDNVSIRFTVPTGEENVCGGFWSDGSEWIYASNMTYDERQGEPLRLQSGSWITDDENVTTASFLIWFDDRILDVWETGISVYYSVDAAAAYSDTGVDFRIYSKGGFEMNYAATGSAGKITGGSPFSLYGNNGSIVYTEL